MQTESDVLTEHHELILSTSIERTVTGRDAALVQIELLIQQLDAVSRLTSEVGRGTAQDWAMKSGHRYDSWSTEPSEKAMLAITRNIDRSIWRDLMLKSGMMALMDARLATSGIKTWKRATFLLLAKPISSVPLSSYIGIKGMSLSAVLSMSSKGCHGIIKLIVPAASGKRSLLTIW